MHVTIYVQKKIWEEVKRRGLDIRALIRHLLEEWYEEVRRDTDDLFEKLAEVVRRCQYDAERVREQSPEVLRKLELSGLCLDLESYCMRLKKLDAQEI